MTTRTTARIGCTGALLLLATALSAQGNEQTFVERFGGGPGKTWTISSTLDPPCLRRHLEDEAPGFHFKSVAVEDYIQSHGYAWAEWNAGTQPFEVSWDVQLDEGLEQNWFYPGVAVAMTSAPPNQFAKDDIAISIGVHMAGLAAAVRQGGFYDLHTEGRGAWANFRDKVLSDLIDRSSGGAASVGWPMKQPGGNRLRCSIRRTEDGLVQFGIHWPGLPGDRGRPYWTGQWQMPDEIAAVPLRYVCVKRMPVMKVHISYPGFVMQGSVQNIQGRLLDAAPGPQVQGCSAREAVLAEGVGLTVHGEHFVEGCRVEIGGKPAKDVQVRCATELTCTLPSLPPAMRHPLTVVNPNNLFATFEGVPYGRMLEQVRPREALPRGGDVVTLVGAGFDRDTAFHVGDQAAEVVQYIGPSQVRLRVPPGDVGPAKISAKGGGEDFAGCPDFGYAPHPYLFFTAEEIPKLRAKFQQPAFRHYRRRIVQQADRLLEEEVGENVNASVHATTTLAMAYVLTDNGAYKEKLLSWIRRGRLATRYDGFHLMSVSGMAVAYDVLSPELSPEDRAAMQDYFDRMLDGYLQSAQGAWDLGGSFNFSNTVPVGNCGGMLAGLALMHSTPKAVEAVDVAAKKARIYPDTCISPEGGCREGIQYWDYGLSFHLMLAHALKNVTGDDRGLLDHPHLKNNVNFIRTQLGGHGGLFAFGDTREPFLDGYAICADLGSRYEQPLMLWIADRAAKGGGKTRARDVWAPFAFLWRSETPAPEQFPGVPTLAWLKDMQWGAMRSDGTFTPKLVVGVKGSQGPLTHHKQNDLGSLVLHANGEAYLVDPGYYEGKATDHTLPLVDGQGPDVTGSSITEAWEQGPWRQMTLDSTEGYGKAAARVRRLIVMHGADRVVVLDDIVAADDAPGLITAQYQAAWVPRIDAQSPNSMQLAGQNGTLRLTCLGHEINLSAEDRTFRKAGWCWEKISESGPGDWHTVSGTYTADADRPLVTVLQTAAAKEPLPPVPVCRFGRGEVEVEFGGGPTIRFQRTEKGWRFVRP